MSDSQHLLLPTRHPPGLFPRYTAAHIHCGDDNLRRANMTTLQFLDEPPSSPALTEYDRAHFKLYMRLLDAQADGADWQEAVSVLFGIDHEREPERARHIHDTHLARAHWMTEHGYRQLLRGRPN